MSESTDTPEFRTALERRNDDDDEENSDAHDWTTATEHAVDVLEELGVDDDRVRERALEISASHDGKIGGRAPSSVAAAAVYIACNEHDWRVTQTEVAGAAGLSPTTVGITFRDLCDKSTDETLSEWCR